VLGVEERREERREGRKRKSRNCALLGPAFKKGERAGLYSYAMPPIPCNTKQEGVEKGNSAYSGPCTRGREEVDKPKATQLEQCHQSIETLP